MALAPWVRPIAYCEIDRYCQHDLLSAMYRGTIAVAPIWDDVRTLSADHLPTTGIDIIYGGFPCQDISIAAPNPLGLEGERSGLFYELMRLVHELRPTFIFLENVSAIAFRGLDEVATAMAAGGYDLRWNMLRASDMGAQHERERWFALAYSDGARLSITRPIENMEGQGLAAATGDSSFMCFQNDLWGEPDAELLRGFDGLSPKTHRIRALGNAVVPAQAREAFIRLINGKQT